jgi:glucose/arabinose dehydrogenase
MLIYTGTMFPERYRGGVFSIQQSAQLMFTMLKEDGSLGVAELFGEDRPTKTSKTFGGLTDIAQMHDGSILLSDELAGAIYRLSYDE